MAEISELKDILDPEKCALLVIDKQVGYFEPMATEPVEMKKKAQNLDKFIEKARQLNVPVIWTQMTESTKLSPHNIRCKMKIDSFRVELEPGEDPYEFYGSTKPATNEKIVEKQFYDAFSNAELAKYLHSTGKTTVVLVGGYGSRCVLATAFGANSNGLHVVLLEDLIWDPPHFDNELPAAFSIAKGILGYILESKDAVDAWTDFSK